MGLILPFCAFVFGLVIARKYAGLTLYLKKILSSLLARIFIPLIIIYNMVFYQAGSLWLIGFSFFSSIVLFSLFYFFKKDQLLALCFSYLNGAWLGLPLALTVFGSAASHTIVALYIGGSLFGNICAVIAVGEQQQSWQQIATNVLKSPPVVALILAGLIFMGGMHAWAAQPWLEVIYQLDKILVTFSGMCVLGMWLSRVKVSWKDLHQALILLTSRLFLAIFLCLLAYLSLPIPHVTLTYAVMVMFFCLPPAANIVALETHYQGTGYSAKFIAAGTIVSCLVILCYGLIWHLYDECSA